MSTTPQNGRQLHLNINIIPSGAHPAAWSALGGHPRGFVEPGLYQEVAQIAEAGFLDAVFLADSLALPAGFGRAPWALDPIVLLTAMATSTSRIGLIGSASTTFSQPYTLARAFLSVDHVAQGRVGWNIVTTYDPNAAANFGDGELPDKAQRYERASEFLTVVRGLWRSWDDDALVADPETGIFAIRDRIHELDHHGRFFTVRGPLSFPRTKQGDPLIVQAGGSPEGRDLAAGHADAVFNAQLTLLGAQEYYRDLKFRARRQGRDPSEVKILPGLDVVVGRTSEDAWRRKEQIDSLIPREVALAGFAARVGLDPGELDWDKPIPPHLTPLIGSGLPHGFGSALRDAARSQAPVGELIRQGAGAHRILVGSAEEVADSMQYWFENGAADGFNINIDVFPDGLERFVELLVPELQRRGLFRTEYQEDTLRQRYARNLGGSPMTDEVATRMTIADLWARSGTLLPDIAEGAARREADRVLPTKEIRSLADAGLLVWRVPAAHGGPGASVHEVMRFIIDLATADANIAQSMRPGFGFVEGLFEADEDWRAQWYERLLRGEMFGGAFGEIGAANGDVRAQLTPEGDHYRANGRKFYSTGALFSDWITITARDPAGQVRSFTVPSDRDGLRLVDDWDAMGQRLTASGSTYLDNVVVFPEELRDWHRSESERSLVIPFQQLFLAAVEAGIARNAVEDAVAYTKQKARPIKHSVASRSIDDPYVQHPVGEMAARAYAAEAAVLRAAKVIDGAHSAGAEHQWQVRAAIEVAQAQFIAVESALRAGELLFDVGGGSTALRSHNLDRHWRNARTVANHNPRYYKAGVVGRYLLTGEDPPNSQFF